MFDTVVGVLHTEYSFFPTRAEDTLSVLSSQLANIKRPGGMESIKSYGVLQIILFNKFDECMNEC